MANLNFNKVIIAGRLTASPEMEQTNGGRDVCSFNVAVNRRTKAGEQAVADFFRVTAWDKAAELVCKYFAKGSSILIVGRLQNRSWTDGNGAKHYATDIVADEINFVDSRSESEAHMAEATQESIPKAYTQPAPNFEQVKPDDDLPF